MWMSLVEMKVWMRGRSESLTAFQAASMSCAFVRASPQMTGPCTSRAIACTASKSPGRGDREARLDDVDAEPRELVRDLELLLPVQRDPRRLLAVAQRRVEDPYSVLLVCGPCRRSLLRPYLLLLVLAAGGRHASFPPKGEKRRSRRAAGRDTRRGTYTTPAPPPGRAQAIVASIAARQPPISSW